jgi:hypothetical protein
VEVSPNVFPVDFPGVFVLSVESNPRPTGLYLSAPNLAVGDYSVTLVESSDGTATRLLLHSLNVLLLLMQIFHRQTSYFQSVWKGRIKEHIVMIWRNCIKEFCCTILFRFPLTMYDY